MIRCPICNNQNIPYYLDTAGWYHYKCSQGHYLYRLENNSIVEDKINIHKYSVWQHYVGKQFTRIMYFSQSLQGPDRRIIHDMKFDHLVFDYSIEKSVDDIINKIEALMLL